LQAEWDKNTHKLATNHNKWLYNLQKMCKCEDFSEEKKKFSKECDTITDEAEVIIAEREILRQMCIKHGVNISDKYTGSIIEFDPRGDIPTE
ncbi:MAG: hypothetical protein HF308_19895, partial [Ignavibacteria bacterium]|nr:hypothetical protein [Ignavibacteria bacterium]